MSRTELRSTLALIVEIALASSGTLLTGCEREETEGTKPDLRTETWDMAATATDARSVERQADEARRLELQALLRKDEYWPIELRTSPPLSRNGFGDAAWGLEVLRKAAGLDWVAFIPYKGARAKPSEAGTPCATSTNKAACRKRVAEVRKAGATGADDDASYLGSYATSKGDAVQLARRKTEVAGLFGIVDSPAKARIVLMAHRYEINGDRWGRSTKDGFELIGSIDTGAALGCGRRLEDQRVEVRADGTVTVLERVQTFLGDPKCYGRRPELFRLGTPASASTLGSFFARAAQLEAASVHAFRTLKGELEMHGAPTRWVRAAEAAAQDEIRHAAMMARLAERFGARYVEPVVERRPFRALFAVAYENAVEGCVRETYGAVEAAMQAARATDPQIARTMRTIARDETRHAQLAWDVERWAREQLTASEREVIDAAMRAEAAELARSARRELDPGVHAIAGVPLPIQASAAVRVLTEQLWR